jgi:endonuclease V-like protein UPF0215 family
MNHEIRTVKREIRILGIDACRDDTIVGSIVRGGLYLDGIIDFHEIDDGNFAEKIRESRYYPELRVVMLHDPKGRLDTRELWKATGLPVIEITKIRSRINEDYMRFEKKNKIIYASSTLEPEMTRQIIHLSWTIDDLPEPVRVAHLLVNSISSQAFSR